MTHAHLPTLLVNAGGASRRMGRNKALLPTPPRGDPLILHMLRRLSSLTQGVILVANDAAVCAAAAPGSPFCLPDAYPDAGPLGGLATGLAHVEQWCLCVACDLPLIQPRVVAHLWSLATPEDPDEPWDAVVPHVHGRPQPLHAFYHRRCLPAIQAQLASGRRRMDSFFPQVRVRIAPESDLLPLDPHLDSFFNANGPDEWKAALARLAAESAPSSAQ